MKKVFCSLLVVSLCCILVSSVFAGPPKTKITFWDENAGPNRTPYYHELIKRFEQKNPNIQVEYVGLPWNNAKQKYDVAIAANAMPDCGSVPMFFLSSFVMKNALLGLDKYFNKWPEKNRINKLMLDGNRSLVKNRRLYMLPNTTTLSLYWYRKDIYKSLGLNGPQTWNELYKDIHKTTDVNKNIYGFSIRGGAGSSTPIRRYDVCLFWNYNLFYQKW